MQNKINYHKILDSVGIPMTVISPVYNKIEEIIDFHVEFANQACILFSFFSVVMPKKFTIMVTKTECNCYFLTVMNSEIDKIDKNYIIRQKIFICNNREEF